MTFNRPNMPTGNLGDDHLDRAQGTLALLGEVMARPGEPAVSGKFSDPSFLLLAGDHGGIAPVSGGRYGGSPGAKVTRHVQCDVDCSFEGLDFIATPGSNNNDTLVSIGAAATVRFTNCRFVKGALLSPTCVTLAAGGRAQFIGCTFGPATATVASVIVNAGVAGNVGVLGSNKTGQPIGTVTTIFLTT